MRILIDECVDPRIKALFPEHDVSTVHDMGWNELTDGTLLALAAKSFDVLLTIDKGLEFQQNFQNLSLVLIVVAVRKNQMPYYQALQQQLLAAIENLSPGQIIHVPRSR
jgi:predicted nuclease of predicted toxin-antitoxin system